MYKPKLKLSAQDINFEPKIITHISLKNSEELQKDEEVQRKNAETIKLGMETLNKSFGEINPKCPYCSAILKKFPKSKEKCKYCGQIFYKRKRPYDNKDILIKENEIGIFERERKRKRFIKTYSIADYNVYESELKKSLNKNSFTFEEVIIYKYKKEVSKYASLNKWHDFIISNNLLLCVYADLGRYYEALKCGLENEYLTFCWPSSYVDGSDFVDKDEMEKIFGKHEILFCDSRLIQFSKKINYSIEDVKNMFFSMEFDDSTFPETRGDTWNNYIFPGFKKYW